MIWLLVLAIPLILFGLLGPLLGASLPLTLAVCAVWALQVGLQIQTYRLRAFGLPPNLLQIVIPVAMMGPFLLRALTLADRLAAGVLIAGTGQALISLAWLLTRRKA